MRRPGETFPLLDDSGVRHDRTFRTTLMKATNRSGVLLWRLSPGLVWVSVILVVALELSVSVQAQPALQNAITTDRGAAERRSTRATPFADIQGIEAGPVRFSLGASYSLEFNDNVNTSEEDPRSDFTHTPMVNLSKKPKSPTLPAS